MSALSPDMVTRFRVAVAGAGPAGFYTAEALLHSDAGIAVDLYDRLPTPYGLVRYGVAPDHPKLKQVTSVFAGIAALPGFRFFGNVAVGTDVSVEVLRRHYHAVVICCGAERDRALGVPGANLPGVHGGMAFVGWYNGHPYQRDLAPDLSGRTAIVLGLGNVALDVARILAKPPEALAQTDIAAHALAALRRSNIGRIIVAARSGPAQARCTEKELREFGSIPDCASTAQSGLYQLPPQTGVSSIFEKFSGDVAGTVPRQCHFAFGMRPIAILGDDRVRNVRFAKLPIMDGAAQAEAAGGTTIDIAADLVVTCIGSEATLVPGLPYADGQSVISNTRGRVVDTHGGVVPGLYASGWIKRGANGTIGTNRADAVETVACLIADLGALPKPASPINALTGAGTRVAERGISFAQWEWLDQVERNLGSEASKPREKITDVKAMISSLATGEVVHLKSKRGV